MSKVPPAKVDSHKLKTPLTSIYGYAQLLQSSSKNLTESQRRWTKRLVGDVRRLISMVEKLRP